MAKTLVRLEQLTGSTTDLKPSSVQSAGTAVASVAHTNMVDIMKYYAQAISNIHGNVDFGAQTPGTLKHNVPIILHTTGSGVGTGKYTTIAVDDYSTNNDSSNVFLKMAQGSSANQETIQLHNLSGEGSAALSLRAGGTIVLTGSGLNADFHDGNYDLYVSGGAFSIDSAASTSDSNVTAGSGKLILGSGKTGADALTIQATHAAGGILVDFGTAGIQFTDDGGSTDLLNIDGDSADFHSTVTVNVDNSTSAGSSTGALVVDGGIRAGASLSSDVDGVDLLATKMVHVGTSQALKIGAHGNDTSGVQAMHTTAELIVSSSMQSVNILAGGSSSQVTLSGSKGIEFAVDQADFSYSGYSGVSGVLLAKGVEAEDFQSLFSTSTTLMGAINSLKSIQTATTFEGVCSNSMDDISAYSDLPLASNLTPATGMTVTSVGDARGSTKCFTTSTAMNELDVYLNGILLSSGSAAAVSAGTKDYRVHGAGILRLGMVLKPNDILYVNDRSNNGTD